MIERQKKVTELQVLAEADELEQAAEQLEHLQEKAERAETRDGLKPATATLSGAWGSGLVPVV